MTQTSHALQQRILDYAAARGYTDSAPHYRACRITITLAQPIAGYDPIHLDGLLQKAVVLDALDGLSLPNAATPYSIPIPLAVLWRSPEGVPLYHSTSLLPEGAAHKATFTWVKRNEPDISLLATRKKDGTLWQPDSGSGVNKEYRMPLPTTSTRHLVGYAVGDMDEIARLLSLLPSIGKKVGTGFGYVSSLVVTPCTPSRCLFVQGGVLARPVPQAALSTLGLHAEGLPALIGYSPPYWLPLNQAPCYQEGTPVRESDAPTPVQVAPRWTVPSFLHYCQQQDFVRHPDRGTLSLLHPKFQRGKGIGTPCALTGLPIEGEGAVAFKDVFASTMGNVVDFLKSPESAWVSNAAAVILSQSKTMHRNLVALVGPQHDGHLLWPTIGVDATTPAQSRPLWREVLLALANCYKGYQCVAVYKDEPKSRTWPRTRIGVVGSSLPLHFSDATIGVSDLLTLDIERACEQLHFVEFLLDKGYGKTMIRFGLRPADVSKLMETLALEKQCAVIRSTPEFPFVWSIARSPADRAVRQGASPDIE